MPVYYITSMLLKLHIQRFVFFIAAFLLILSCDEHVNHIHHKGPVYKSFREIPSVTPLEIQAIEALKAKDASFVYGAVLGTEAFYGKNGEIKGYAALLSEHLTELFGIKFKPAIYEWGDLLAGLASGQIDFTSDLTATEERRKIYSMTDALAERSIKYFRLKDATPISQIIESRLPRYAFLEGSIILNMVSSFSNHEFEYSFFPSHSAVYEALKSGQVDALLDESNLEAFFDAYEDIVLTDFYPLIYNSISLSTQKPELVPIISIVQKMLQTDCFSYLIEIYNNSQQEYIKSKLERSFTKEELEYIRKNPVVPFAAEFDNYPISFYNKHENQWQGIVFDVLREVEKITELSFEVSNAPGAEWHDLLKNLENGNIPMVSELIRSKDRKGRFIWPETSLIQDKHALISRLEYPDISINEVLRAKVGLAEETAHANTFRILFPNHSNVVEFKSTNDALEALKLGNIDLLMASNNTILAMLHYMELPGFKVNILFDIPYESYFGFNKNERILSSIVDKALKRVDIKKIAEQWKQKNYDYRIKFAELQFRWLIGASVLFFLVIILLLLLYKRIHGEEKRLEILVQKRTAKLDELLKIMEEMSLTDQLTNLPNRRSFNMRLNMEWRVAIREKHYISFMMLDIDHFKIYNDKYGHQQGDEVLRMVAKTIEHTLKRPSDFVARWGGEEFAILLPNTDLDGALNIAEAIRVNIGKENLLLTDGTVTKVTVSIGVNALIPERGGSLENFIYIADKELYRAKEMGRNKICFFIHK
jgi:diguanylate cyclase (GGDEF)-like protein